MNLPTWLLVLPMIAQPQPLAPVPLGNAEAWALLPGATAAPKPLPSWARMLAKSMPRATAGMLRLDALTRTTPSLSPRLRCLVRLAVAEANHSEYGRAIALSDLKEWTGASGVDASRLSGPEKQVWDFCHQLALEAQNTTDQQVKNLLVEFSEPQVVAMVLMVAHGSFQDRLFLTLRPPVETEGGGVPRPVLASFDLKAPPPPAKKAGEKPPSKPPATQPAGQFENFGPTDATWAGKKLNDLMQGMEKQKARKGRIRIPEWKEVEPRLELDSSLRKWPRVAWGLVAFGGQPEMADAWFTCVEMFRLDGQPAKPPTPKAGQDKADEAKPMENPSSGPPKSATPALDRMIQADMFWVVTRALDCFY